MPGISANTEAGYEAEIIWDFAERSPAQAGGEEYPTPSAWPRLCKYVLLAQSGNISDIFWECRNYNKAEWVPSGV
jgi:hypothetical protein